MVSNEMNEGVLRTMVMRMMMLVLTVRMSGMSASLNQQWKY